MTRLFTMVANPGFWFPVCELSLVYPWRLFPCCDQFVNLFSILSIFDIHWRAHCGTSLSDDFFNLLSYNISTFFSTSCLEGLGAEGNIAWLHQCTNFVQMYCSRCYSTSTRFCHSFDEFLSPNISHCETDNAHHCICQFRHTRWWALSFLV